MPKLLIVHGTTRPSRIGIHVSRAFEALAREVTDFDVEFVDLQELALPFLDEMDHPRAGNYQLKHTLEWARTVGEAQAIVWASAEYNHSFTAPLKNAIDFLSAEWSGKPLGIIAWGAASGGSYAANALKPVAEALRLNLVAEPLLLPMFFHHISDAGFAPTEEWLAGAKELLNKLEASANA